MNKNQARKNGLLILFIGAIIILVTLWVDEMINYSESVKTQKELKIDPYRTLPPPQSVPKIPFDTLDLPDLYKRFFGPMRPHLKTPKKSIPEKPYDRYNHDV